MITEENMIGNDVIDLALAHEESDWQREGFLDKMFTQEEQVLILNYSMPETMVWILWSMKESAYKIYNRQTGNRAYIPLSLICHDLDNKDNCFFGRVKCEDQDFFTMTFISNDCIETIAVEKYEYFKKISIVDDSTIITKINDLPGFYDENKQRFRSVSVSHHGRYKRIVAL